MQTYNAAFTPRAERQLLKLYADIADSSGEARADNYVGGLVAYCLSLETFPQREHCARTFDQIYASLGTRGAQPSRFRSIPQP